jgi:hypothetical protein
VQYFSDGSKYEGGWEKDRKVGAGVLTSRDGSVYDGNWFNDTVSERLWFSVQLIDKSKKTGKGKFTSANGAVYEGEWIADQRQGSGIVNWPDGSCYSGSWSMDLVCFRSGLVFGWFGVLTGMAAIG